MAGGLLYRQFFAEYKNLHSAVRDYVLQLDKNAQSLFPELVQPQKLVSYLEETKNIHSKENEKGQSAIAQFEYIKP